MAYETLILFFITDLLFCLSPGPATIVCASHAANGGMRNAFGPIMGIHAGNFIWYALSALGLVALVQTAPNLYNIIRWAGVAYLLWMAFTMLRESRASLALNERGNVKFTRGFMSGLAVHMSNPKALLFYAAFLPQFIEPQINIILQITILAAITVVTESIGLLFYSSIAAGARSIADSAKISVISHYGSAIVLILVALFMAYLNYSEI